MARHLIDKEAVSKAIDDMDNLDGTDYGSILDEDQGDDDERQDLQADQTGTQVEGEEGEEEPFLPFEQEVQGTQREKRSAQSTKRDGKGDKQDGQQPDTRTQAPTGDEPRKAGKNFVDKAGNIIDPRTKQVIAKAGQERRLYERSQRLGTILEDAQKRLAKYEAEEQTTTTLMGSIRQHGLVMDDVAEAINIAIQYKQNPVLAAKTVLERVLALGHNVTDILGADAGNAIEMRGVSRMIDERLAPIIQPLQEQRASSERTQKAEVAFQQWVNDNEYADVHLEAIDSLIGQNPDLTPQKAYNALLTFAVKHGLDFSQPLGPQLAARQGAQTTSQQERRVQKPFPVNASGGSNPRPLTDKDYANSDDSWADIVRSGMSMNR
jgi:hypothetical protein